MTAEDHDLESLASTCTVKERAFAEEYIVDLNATQAFIRCGCFNATTTDSAGSMAATVLGRPRVKALVEILTAQRAARVAMTADSVLHEMSLLSHSNQAHYVIDDNGRIELAEGAPEGAMRAIQSVKRKKTIREDKDGNVTITYDVELRLWEKPGPLKLMGRHVGLFPNTVELTGKGGGPVDVVARIERVIVDPKAQAK